MDVRIKKNNAGENTALKIILDIFDVESILKDLKDLENVSYATGYFIEKLEQFLM